jgi:hypothetical protein
MRVTSDEKMSRRDKLEEILGSIAYHS